jgi:hypothetical protein
MRCWRVNPNYQNIAISLITWRLESEIHVIRYDSFQRARLQWLRKNSPVHLILGGAALVPHQLATHNPNTCTFLLRYQESSGSSFSAAVNALF